MEWTTRSPPLASAVARIVRFSPFSAIRCGFVNTFPDSIAPSVFPRVDRGTWGPGIEPRKAITSGCRRRRERRKATPGTPILRGATGPCAVTDPEHVRKRTGQSRCGGCSSPRPTGAQRVRGPSCKRRPLGGRRDLRHNATRGGSRRSSESECPATPAVGFAGSQSRAGIRDGCGRREGRGRPASRFGDGPSRRHRQLRRW